MGESKKSSKCYPTNKQIQPFHTYPVKAFSIVCIKTKLILLLNGLYETLVHNVVMAKLL